MSSFFPIALSLSLSLRTRFGEEALCVVFLCLGSMWYGLVWSGLVGLRCHIIYRLCRATQQDEVAGRAAAGRTGPDRTEHS